MNEAPDTRISLILRLQRPADEAAWHEFWSLYQPVIYRVARRSGLQDADATDVAQEVLRRVAVAVERFEPGAERGSFRGWLRTITRNLVIQFIRGRTRRQALSNQDHLNEVVSPPRGEEDPTSRLFETERQRELFAWAAEAVRHQCQSSTWQAFWRTAVESQSVAEVARELGMTSGSVYVARSRVMARLREMIQQREHDDEV